MDNDADYEILRVDDGWGPQLVGDSSKVDRQTGIVFRRKASSMSGTYMDSFISVSLFAPGVILHPRGCMHMRARDVELYALFKRKRGSVEAPLTHSRTHAQ
jgi:hypothetical protein